MILLLVCGVLVCIAYNVADEGFGVSLNNKALEKNSQVLLEQIRTLDKTRLISKIGKATENEMKAIDQSVEISLSLGGGD